MTSEELFWQLNESRADEIRSRARSFYTQFGTSSSLFWNELREEEQFPWCLAAERHLTAVAMHGKALRFGAGTRH